MSIRTEIQNQIITFVESGTFNIITYSGNVPTDTGTPIASKRIAVYVNETGGSLDKSSDRMARNAEQYILKGWNFEVRVKFNKEVDIDYFLTEELGKLRISSPGVRISIDNVSYVVEHPVTAGSPTGTQLLINLTVNTRR